MRSAKVKTRIGIVSSTKMDKTILVEVTRIVHHKRLGKPIKRTSKFMAHDERNECNVGDKVNIVETRPLSKNKCWRVSEILGKGVLGLEDKGHEIDAAEGGAEE